MFLLPTLRWLLPNGGFEQGDTLMAILEGEYLAQAINVEGCASVDSFLVIDEPVPPVFDFISDSLYCFGDVELTALDVEDDLLVTWLGPNNLVLQGEEVTTGDPGEYELIVTGINMCRDTIDFEVFDARNDPIAVVMGNSLFQCVTDEVKLSSEGSSTGNDISYSWSSADGTILSGENNSVVTVLGPGTYTLKVTDNRTGCFSEFPYELIKDEQSFSEVLFDISPPSCKEFANAYVTFEFVSGFPPYEVVVNGNSYGAKDSVKYLRSGEHFI